jgi:two-component system nitrogen regulation response regulator GlnG
MPTLRVFRGGTPLVEIDLAGERVEVGDRPGDGVRLDELGLAGVAGGGGRLERRAGTWWFVPRTGGDVPRALERGQRIAVGDGALELDAEAPGARVDVGSLPAEDPRDLPFVTPQARAGSAAARLSLLADVLARVDEGPSGDELLVRALDAAFGLVDAQRGVAARLEPDGRTLRVVAARNLPGDDPRRSLSRRVLDAVLGEGRDVVTGDAPVDIPTVSVNMAMIRALCALPLKVRGRVVGLLYVDRSSLPIPFLPEDVVFLRLLAAFVARRLEEDERIQQAESRTRALSDSLARRGADEDARLGWTSPAMRRVKSEAERMLKAFQGRSLPVLITGESGTGKEVLARWLHDHIDERTRGPFVALNCAAIPHDLAESELFGIEQGVASGVLKRVGRLQQAHGGTLFLDEVGEMALPVQAKLLRALETRRITRVGGREEIAVEVRLVSATNASLPDAIKKGRFREDLYWRLTGVDVRLPALRERREDIPVLVQVFAAHFAAEFGVPPLELDREALGRLLAWHWPGNVRELRQRVGALTALCGGSVVHVEDLPPEIRAGTPPAPLDHSAGGSAPPQPGSHSAGGSAPLHPPQSAPAAGEDWRTLAQVEMEHIRRVLAAVGGDRGRAADVLGIHRKTLGRRLGGTEADGVEGGPA